MFRKIAKQNYGNTKKLLKQILTLIHATAVFRD